VVSTNNLTESFDVETLSPGKSEEREFHAFLVGDKGNIKVAKALLNFDAGNLKSTFQKTAELATTITGLPVALTLSAAPNAVSGQTVSYILDYRNDSSNSIADVQFVFKYPDGFTPQRFSPSTSQGNNTWSLSSLKQGQGNRISITGTITGSQGQAKPISVSLKRKIGDIYVDYETAGASTMMSLPFLNISISANNVAEYIAHPGDDLAYIIQYQNASNFTFNGLTLSVKLEGDMYDFASLNTQGGYFDSSSKTITWNSTVVSDFDNLRPNTKGQIAFRIKVKQNTGSNGSGNLFVKNTASLVTLNVPSGVDADKISSQDELVTRITSQPTLRQAIYYNDPAFGLSGPTPPEVGKETVYTIHWQITNPGNDLSSAKITAILPQGVTWKNVISVTQGQPDPTFNRNNSQLTWNIGQIPSGIGITTPKYEASFQVSIKPSSDQVGGPVTLIKNTLLSGIDNFTQQNIGASVYDATTNDTVDRAGQGSVK
ncbi:hypothetical protein KW791_03430, partial [Candidatus Parcubacteria bacterium]|nr:hypothetical protein [Candidatus Parcubacteria bacterium]